MTRGLGLVALVFITAGCASTSGPAGRSVLIQQMLASTVQVRSEREGGIRRAASGVVVAADNGARRAWILTVGHFVNPPRPQQLSVRAGRAKSAVPAKVAFVDSDLDLAIIEAEHLDLMPVRLKDVTRLGDEIVIVAFPWGGPFTVVHGRVSQIATADGEAQMAGPAARVDASVSYGSSGGGAFDAGTGELIGIVRSYRTAKVAIPELKDRVIEVPIPGDTALVPASTIARFVRASGLAGHLTK